nr:hypothetical protein MACL_00000019 [Theileria orientalis]
MQEDVNSNHLLINMENSNRRRARRTPLGFPIFRQRRLSGESQGEVEANPDRSVEVCLYIALVFVLMLILGLNFIPWAETPSLQGGPVLFSTYYTSKYNLCLTYEDKNAVTGGEVGGREKECIDGDVDITLLYKDVALEGYYRVYAVFSFELDYQGKWYAPWKKKHFFSSKNKDKRLVIGLSNLIHQGTMRATNAEEALENIWDYTYLKNMNAENNSKDASADDSDIEVVNGSGDGHVANRRTETVSDVTVTSTDHSISSGGNSSSGNSSSSGSIGGGTSTGNIVTSSGNVNSTSGIGNNNVTAVNASGSNSSSNEAGNSKINDDNGNSDIGISNSSNSSDYGMTIGSTHGNYVTGATGFTLDSTGDSDGETGGDESGDLMDDEYAKQLKKQLLEFLNNELREDEDDESIERDIEKIIGAGTGSDMDLVFASGEDNESETTEGVTLYLNSFVPNFINVNNMSSKMFKGLTKGDSTYNIYNEGKSLLNSIRLNTWNEFSSQFNVYNYNLQLNLKDNPLELYLASQRKRGKKSRGGRSGREKMKNKAKSLRMLDEFYLLNLRKFVQNEYQHISNFDTSLLNIFNVFKTMNPYRHYFKKKKTETKETESKTRREESKHIPDDDDVKLDQETLNKYFGPVDWNAKPLESAAADAVAVKTVKSSSETNKIKTIRIGGNSDESDSADGKQEKESGSGSGGYGGVGESERSTGAGTGPASGETDIEGAMWCNDMNVDVTFKGKEKSFKSLRTAANVFLILFMAKALSEIGLLWRQFEVVESAAQGRTVSLMTLSLLSFQDVLDLFLLLYHANSFIDMAPGYLLMIISKALIICMLYQNLIVLVWRASHSYHIRRGWMQTQKSFLLFYKYYFTFMGIVVIILYFFYEAFPFLIVLSFWSWVPQILLDVWRGHNNSLSMAFIVSSVVLKMFFPIYLFFTPTNVFTVDKFASGYLGQNRKLVYIITFIASVQLILIAVQRLKGPRSFVSWSILPKIYSYVRPWSKIMQDDDQECVICMYDIVQSNRDWCLTPCDHLFHTKCLKDWTSINKGQYHDNKVVKTNITDNRVVKAE